MSDRAPVDHAPVDRARLRAAIERHETLAIAVSGGVDSMTLAHFAARETRVETLMVHALSPAVPARASARVREHAARWGWRLIEADAGEFADPRYRANPANRCYFCKSNLYDRIRGLTEAPIASGANLDDLDDWRPGLIAAAERGVVHPFVEAEFPKAAVRALAHALGLEDIAELPAQPCLSSRVETAIEVKPEDLAFIDAAEQAVQATLPADATVRCRMTHGGVVLQLGTEDGGLRAQAAALVEAMCARTGRPFAGVGAYVRGSAFLRGAA